MAKFRAAGWSYVVGYTEYGYFARVWRLKPEPGVVYRDSKRIPKEVHSAGGASEQEAIENLTATVGP